MQSVSNQFLNLQNRYLCKYFTKAYLYRRYWVVATNTYVWETSPYAITKWMKNAPEINSELDKNNLQEWKIENITLIVTNKENEWDEKNSDGFWNGYIAYMSKVEIKAGYIDENGIEYPITVFTGIISQEIEIDDSTKMATIVLSGISSMLDITEAEKVSNKITGEVLGEGAGGTRQVFETDYNCVGKISAIYINGDKLYDNGYTVSNLHTKSLPATIIIQPAPPIGAEVTCNYIYWHIDQNLVWLAEQLLNEAGFDVDHREVGDLLFFDSFLEKIWDIHSDWSAILSGEGTHKRNIDIETEFGSVLLKKENYIGATLSGVEKFGNDQIRIAELFDIVYDCNELPQNSTPV